MMYLTPQFVLAVVMWLRVTWLAAQWYRADAGEEDEAVWDACLVKVREEGK